MSNVLTILSLCLSINSVAPLLDSVGHQRSGAAAAQTSRDPVSPQEVWTVYDRTNFGESELCGVLNCRKRDYCLVKGEDAICLARKKLRDAPGRKVFFRRSDPSETDETPDATGGIRGRPQPVRQSSVSKPRHRSQAATAASARPPISDPPPTAVSRNQAAGDNTAREWDPDRVRHKLAAYYRSVKRKERNRAAMNRPNNYDLPNTHKETGQNANTGQRASEDTPKKKRCTQEQLADIGVRLPQWFRDLQSHHEPVPVTSWHKRPLHYACRREALWMFNQLDHDSDDALDSDELYALTYDQYEPCVKPFLDRCDRNTDNRLSLQEWCVCFH